MGKQPRPVEKGGKNRKDRNCICFAQCFIGPGLFCMMIFWGCTGLEPGSLSGAAHALTCKLAFAFVCHETVDHHHHGNAFLGIGTVHPSKSSRLRNLPL